MAIVRARRDTALRALLDNDGDRARFDAHAAAMMPGTRGGGVAPAMSINASGRGGRGNPAFDTGFTSSFRISGTINWRADSVLTAVRGGGSGDRSGGGVRSGGAGGSGFGAAQLGRAGGDGGRGSASADTASLNRFNERQ